MILTIDSPIAGGKTVLLDHISKYMTMCNNKKVIVIEEDVDKPRNVKGQNLLRDYYNDKSRWAFTFQFFMFMSKIKSVINTVDMYDNNTIFVIERSWFADRFAFAALLHEKGYFTKSEWFTYNKLCDYMSNVAPNIDGYIFIKCSIDTHMLRLRQRNRPEESDITEDYELSLMEKHNSIIDILHSQNKNILILDGEPDIVNNSDNRKRIFDEISNFVAKLNNAG